MTVPSILIDTQGLTIGWATDAGPGIAHFASWKDETPAWVRYVGKPGLSAAIPPQLVAVDTHLIAFWIEDDGAMGALLNWENGEILSGPQLVLEKAESVAAGGGREVVWLFGHDQAGILGQPLDLDLKPLETPTRCVRFRGVPFMAAATVRNQHAQSGSLREQGFLVYAYRSQAGFGVVRHPLGEGADWVRHSLPFAVKSLSLFERSGRAAIALLLENREVQVGLASVDGGWVTKMHTLVPSRDGRDLISPNMLWTDDSFSLLVGERWSRTIEAHPLDEDGRRFELDAHGDAFQSGYHKRHCYLVSTVESEQGVGTCLIRSARNGRSSQQLDRQFVASDEFRQRSQIRARTLMIDVGAHLGARGYRTVGARTEVLPNGALEMELETGLLSVQFLVAGNALRLSVRHAPASTESQRAIASKGVFGWLRSRFGGGSSQSNKEDLAWATSLVEGMTGQVVTAQRTKDARAFQLQLDDFPDAEPLAQWVKALKRHFGPQDT